MSEALKLEIETICTTHLIAIIFAIVFLAFFIIRLRHDHAMMAFVVMQLSMIGWMLFKVFKTVSPTEVARWWFIVAYYFCACLFEVAFLEFAFAYYSERPLAKWIRSLLYSLALIQFSWVITNPWHFMFYSQYDFWDDRFGPLFYIHMIIEYGIISIGFYYCVKTFNRSLKTASVGYKLAVAAMIISPLIINFLYITGKLKLFLYSIGVHVLFDITPLVFVVSTTAFIHATLNYQYWKMLPIYRHEIVEKMDTPIAVLDSSFKLLFTNQKMKAILAVQPQLDLVGQAKVIASDRQHGQPVEMPLADHNYHVFLRSVANFDETNYLLTLNDITDYRRIEHQIDCERTALQTVNRELEASIEALKQASIQGARHHVARELHDIMGHSLVVAIKLLEVAQIYYERDKPLSQQALNDAIQALQDGKLQLMAGPLHGCDYSVQHLRQELANQLERLNYTTLQTHLSLRGECVEIRESLYDTILRVCSELLTNALKHSSARDIFISLNVKRTGTDIVVMDNGRGRENLRMGNGLSGIRQRVALLDGHVEFTTAPGEGFTTKISIP